MEDKKKALKKLLEEIKEKQVSKSEFGFMGRCGNTHVVDTNKPFGKLLPGQFFQLDCSDCGEKHIWLYVGMGKGCENYREVDVPWFLAEDEEGLSNYGTTAFEEFEKEGFTITE